MPRIFLIMLFVSGCQTSQAERWQLPTGEQIICLKYEQAECGLLLKKCGDERSVDFDCMSEAKYLGPGDYFEPDIFDEPSKPKPPVKKPAKAPAKKPAIKEKCK